MFRDAISCVTVRKGKLEANQEEIGFDLDWLKITPKFIIYFHFI